MAEKRGLTKSQINRILMEIKKGLRADAKGDAAKEAKVEAFIKEKLSRPEDAVGNKGGGKVRNALNNVISDILGNL